VFYVILQGGAESSLKSLKLFKMLSARSLRRSDSRNLYSRVSFVRFKAYRKLHKFNGVFYFSSLYVFGFWRCW